MKYVPYNSNRDSFQKYVTISNDLVEETRRKNYYSSSNDYTYIFEEIFENLESLSSEQLSEISKLMNNIISTYLELNYTKKLPKVTLSNVDDAALIEWVLGTIRLGFSFYKNAEENIWFSIKKDSRNFRTSSGFINDSREEYISNIKAGLSIYESM